MIVVRTPLRLCLGGGGTDLPSFANRHGSYVVSATIDKFITTIVQPQQPGGIRFFWQQFEESVQVDNLKHDLLRVALQDVSWSGGANICSLSDVPSGTGLGSSGAFLVGLRKALGSLQGHTSDCLWLAETAFQLEANRLGRPVGRQDHYIAAYGGIRVMRFGGHQPHVTTLSWSDEVRSRFEYRLRLYWTGMTRSADSSLAEQSAKAAADDAATIQLLHSTKALGQQAASCLRTGDLDGWADTCHEHSQLKRQLAGGEPTQIDAWCEMARQAGAKAAKNVGAGGGGYLLCYAEDFSPVTEVLCQAGLHEVPFRFYPRGSEVI